MKDKDNRDLVIKTDGIITKLRVYKKVMSSGGSGAVSLPKQLVGKIVLIEYGVENESY